MVNKNHDLKGDGSKGINRTRTQTLIFIKQSS